MLEGTKRKRTFMCKTDPPSIMQMTHCTLESDWHPKAVVDPPHLNQRYLAIKVPATMPMKRKFFEMPSNTLISSWILRLLISLKHCINTKTLNTIV
jgi:hypothetical protein